MGGSDGSVGASNSVLVPKIASNKGRRGGLTLVSMHLAMVRRLFVPWCEGSM
jgi:hypothetical protein